MVQDNVVSVAPLTVVRNGEKLQFVWNDGRMEAIVHSPFSINTSSQTSNPANLLTSHFADLREYFASRWSSFRSLEDKEGYVESLECFVSST